MHDFLNAIKGWNEIRKCIKQKHIFDCCSGYHNQNIKTRSEGGKVDKKVSNSLRKHI